MKTRGSMLMTTANHQLDATAASLAALGSTNLHLPCHDDSGEVDHGANAADTVGLAAAHLVDGYRRLSRFLNSLSPAHAPAAPSLGRGHAHETAGEAGSDLLAGLVAVRPQIGVLAELTDEELDSVSGAVNRFADGERTLEQAIEAMLAHQAAHLDALRRAVA